MMLKFWDLCEKSQNLTEILLEFQNPEILDTNFALILTIEMEVLWFEHKNMKSL